MKVTKMKKIETQFCGVLRASKLHETYLLWFFLMLY